jgi:hypothetical protein
VNNDFGSAESEVIEFLVSTFNPLDITGIKLWLDASVLVESGLNWLDQSGNENHAVKYNTPTVVTNAQNGFSLMRYESVNSGTSTDYHEWNDIYDIRTVFAVCKRVSGNVGSILTDDNSYHFYSDGSKLLNGTFGHDNIQNGQFKLNGIPITATSTYFPSNLSIITIRTTGNVQASRIGRERNVDRNNFAGDFGELIIYNYPLLDSEVLMTEGYLAHKWGLTANLPVDHPYKTSAP